MITPYKRPPKVREVGLVDREGRIIFEDGTSRSLATRAKGPRSKSSTRKDDAVLFCDRQIAMDHVLGGAGSVLRWNDVPYRWDFFGRKVILLGGWPGDGPEVLASLAIWRDWLAAYGAGIGSIRQASRSLLRATISSKLILDGGDPPPIRDVIGGRQAPLKPSGYYEDVELWDIEAAYARTMGEMSYGGRWYDIGSALPDRDRDIPAICHARVWIPKRIKLGPLPRRAPRADSNPHLRRLLTRDYPTAVRLQGFWTHDELLQAERAGCSVKIDRTWVMPGQRRPFAPWWDAIREGRSLPGLAGRLAKGTGNALWGSFIAEGARTRLDFSGKVRREVPEPASARPVFKATAELICSRVRVRLYSELITPNFGSVIGVHTDGGIAQAGSGVDLPPGWRCKATADHLIYIGPQAFAYRSGSHITYKVSGVPADVAPEIFASICTEILKTPPRGKLPSAVEAEAIRMLRKHFDVKVPA